MQSRWWHSPMIIFSAIAANFATFMHLGAVLSSFIVIWFLFVCPGMVIIHFLHLHEFIVEYVLALALSLAIDALVATLLLYAGWWSPTGILNILVSFCLVGAIVQLVCSRWVRSLHREDNATQQIDSHPLSVVQHSEPSQLAP